ncbi:unnamed protein product [Tilletia caries]|uniref:HAT C-terminal dimerisation domain-containing protein n=1 Tax=Tilletia caries TaxID=13290 RepID=A0ABN7IQH7_9BASI|nr:unnamed protein product [Tilletia caries]CAD6913789.1 unnamed protein product [Tilletia caries]
MEVRWNSTLAQLLGLQRLEPALRHLFESGHSTSAWSEQVWLAMRDTIKILNGFKDVSDHLQGRSFPTISAAAEGYIIMNKGLEELRAASTLTPWGMEVLALFDTRLTEYREHLIDTFVVQWATILDPSMKAEVIPTNNHAPSSSSAPISAYEKRRQKFAAAAPAPITIDAGKQLELYLAEPPIPTPAPSDSLHYWSVNQSRYPSLAALARDLLAIPATSVPSEAAFSRGGEVITKRRNRLSGTTVTHIMCLDSWMNAGFTTIKDFVLNDLVEDE